MNDLRHETMASLRYLRLLVALMLGVAVAIAVHHWPASPRAVMQYDQICWHMAFSRDSTKLAALDREAGLNTRGQIFVWDLATGNLLHRLDNGKTLYASKVVFAPDGQSLGVVDAGTVTKWDLNTGRKVAHYDHASWSHDPEQYYGREILFSPTGRWLAHDVYAGRIYDVETGQVVLDYAERWPDRNLSAQGGRVTALVGGEIKTFDVLTCAEIGTFPATGKRGPMARSAFTCSPDGTCGVYFTDQWVVHNAVTGGQCGWGSDLDNMVDCCLSADNRFLAVSLAKPRSTVDGLLMRLLGTRRCVHVFDTATGAQVRQPIRGGCLCCFAPDGKTLAIASTDKSIALWDWPPPPRWPLTLALAVPTMLLSYGLGRWWSRRVLGGGRVLGDGRNRCVVKI